jgi:hypothetical protein
MRVDKLHNYFQSLLPPKSQAYQKFYEKAYDPAMYEEEGIDQSKGTEKQKVTLFIEQEFKTQTFLLQIIADIVGVEMNVVLTKEKSKSLTGGFPYLETDDGSVIGETEAIAKFLARMNLATGLLGKHQLDHAKVNEWIAWCQTSFIQYAIDA